MKCQLRSIFTIASIWWIMILATSIMTGCSPERGQAQGKAAAGAADADVLRVRHDAARNRTWLLSVDAVRVYEAASKKLIRQVPLPNWSVARFACEPDLVLDTSGSAIVSSNVQSRLWRIDGDKFEVNEREINLQGRERWEVGFGALMFAADGTLYALTSSAGSLWKVDFAGASASMMEPKNPPSKACAFTAQFLRDFGRSR